MVAAIKSDYRQASLSGADRAMLDFAAKLTLSPSGMTRADVDGLKRHGFGDDAVNDIAQVTALFAYFNRLADGLGIDLEPDMPQRDQAG